MSLPAAAGASIIYSHLLDSTGAARPAAHAAFEAALDATPAVPAEQMTVADKRRILAAGIRARGEDAAAKAGAS